MCAALWLQQVRDVLHKRMNMKNPHKVWLATHLAEDILKKCTDTIGPIRSDIYQVPEMCAFIYLSLARLPHCVMVDLRMTLCDMAAGFTQVLRLAQDLAAIAGKPLDRYQVNFKDEQRAKMHAFAVLRSTKQGQSVLRHTLKMGRYNCELRLWPPVVDCSSFYPATWAHGPRLDAEPGTHAAGWSASRRRRTAARASSGCGC